MNVKQLLGARVKSLHGGKGRTQEQLAERAGLNGNYLSRVERGIENPTLDTLLSLAKALEVEPLDLFWFEHEELDLRRLRQLLAHLVKEVKDDQLWQVVKALQSLVR